MVQTDPRGDDDRPRERAVDDLRQRLRALGYLDAGVDRFVLAPAQAARRPLVFTLLSALRVGMLAALLLGPAATLGVAARVPGLITGPRDALVVAAYLGTAFAAALTMVTLCAALAIAGAARMSPATIGKRARLLTQVAGAAVAAACLVYFTFWWRTLIAGVGWSAPWWTASALGIAAAISLVLGHAVAVVAAAILVAFGDAGDAARQRAWRSTVIAGMVAFAGAALLLTWSGAANASGDRPAPLTVVPSGMRVKVIAIDGFDPRVFAELAAAHRVPTLAAAFSGAVARLAAGPDWSPDPARIWTTVATGQPASSHGVYGLETRRVPGIGGMMATVDRAGPWAALRHVTDLLRFTQPAIVSGSERRAKTFWEVAAETGLRTAVVNWWVTWPATATEAIVLSDRATLRLEHGGDLDAEMAPASLYGELLAQWPALKARAAKHALGVSSAPTGASSAPTGASLMTDSRDGPIAQLIRRSIELDAVHLELQKTVTSNTTDLSVAYLPGLDIVQHTLLGDRPSGVAASTLSERLGAITNYYVILDALLGSYAALEPQGDDVVIVVTQPGRVGDVADGRLAARGRRTSSSQVVAGSQLDVAPTLLYALGLPVASDLRGTPLTSLFSSEFTSAYPVRSVRTYGSRSRGTITRTNKPLDQEMIDRLRSLGYVR